ncbi:TPA: branched-chain amino acid ABC transporter permease [bacterium]|nr:branched-chain amino acid ABC transporter permease [bacterium]
MNNSTKYREAVIWILLFVGFGALPLLKASGYQLMLASHILLWGLFAVAFNMLWGVTGMLSFGQALYYGLGAYSVGLMVKHLGDAWFLPGLGLGLVASIILSAILGLLIIRVSGVFFTVLTLAFGQLAWQITFRWYDFTGGDDGIQGIIPPSILSNKITYYYFTLVIVIASIWLLRKMSQSPMGVLLRCVRQNPNRLYIPYSMRDKRHFHPKPALRLPDLMPHKFRLFQSQHQHLFHQLLFLARYQYLVMLDQVQDRHQPLMQRYA